MKRARKFSPGGIPEADTASKRSASPGVRGENPEKEK
jgi:hypothetical protein